MGWFRQLTESLIQIASQQFSLYRFCVLQKDTWAGKMAADENAKDIEPMTFAVMEQSRDPPWGNVPWVHQP